MLHSELCRRRESPPRRLSTGKRSAPGPGAEGGDGCLHRLLVSVLLAGRVGRGAVQGGGSKDACGEQGTELPEPFPRGAGGVSLAWLLPISFTSGWNRWRGVGWKSPSGCESHKCVNKCDDQSLLRCPGNSGLAGGGMPGCQFFPHPRSGLSGKEKLWKKSFSKENSCSLSCHSYFCFK